jgi:hypothetical protein
MGPSGDGSATGRGRGGRGRGPGVVSAERLPQVDLLAAGLGLALECSAARGPAAANDAASEAGRADDDDVRDGQGPPSGWRGWFGAVVRETLDSTGTFRS